MSYPCDTRREPAFAGIAASAVDQMRWSDSPFNHNGTIVDWNDQLRASLIWLGEAFAISSIGLTITLYVPALFTGWGRQVRRISWAYFDLLL